MVASFQFLVSSVITENWNQKLETGNCLGSSPSVT